VIRVLIADDHAIVRRGVVQVFADIPDIDIIGEASSGQEVLRLVDTGAYDVLLLDIAMPDSSGLDVLKQVRTICPSLPVLVLSVYSEKQYAVRCLRAGAAGYLTKESAPTELVTAVRQAAAGGKYVTTTLAALLTEDQLSPAAQAPHHTLSDREFQVLQHLAAGDSINDIAAHLSISPKTVTTYRSRILEKLGLKTTADLIRYAMEHELGR
jgi:two-component system, NarL family, invasion response regulator UvrY